MYPKFLATIMLTCILSGRRDYLLLCGGPADVPHQDDLQFGTALEALDVLIGTVTTIGTTRDVAAGAEAGIAAIGKETAIAKSQMSAMVTGNIAQVRRGSPASG